MPEGAWFGRLFCFGTRLAGALACSLLLDAALAAEAPLPQAPKNYFNDYAGLVAPAVARRLEERLRRFDTETSNQFVVAIFPELPAPSMEDFTARTARAWRVGRKKLDNGVVLFVFAKNRKIRLEVGYGLEGALPDALAKRIIDETIAPALKAGNHAQGLEAGIVAVMAATKGEYRAVPRPPPAQRYSSSQPGSVSDFDLFLSRYGPWLLLLLIAPIPLLVLYTLLTGGFRGGGGVGTLDSGQTWSSSDSSWSSSGSSDFSGGGGDFGGGGASGDW